MFKHSGVEKGLVWNLLEALGISKLSVVFDRSLDMLGWLGAVGLDLLLPSIDGCCFTWSFGMYAMPVILGDCLENL